MQVLHGVPWRLKRLNRVDFHVGRTMFETDRLPEGCVEACNRMDELWVPSRFGAEVFQSAGVPAEKLFVVPGAISEEFLRQVRPLEIEGQTGFTFLSVFDWSIRKGWDVLLRAFVEEFTSRENVTLLLSVGSSRGLSREQIRPRR